MCFCLLISFCYNYQKECAQRQQFLESLKDSQGSLEHKTNDEINTINEFGLIIIGRVSSEIHYTPPEILIVQVIPSSKHDHPPKEYTFQELEDLITRIVLIAGKGKTANQTGLMQKFLEVS